jgi:hypothetical protein
VHNHLPFLGPSNTRGGNELIALRLMLRFSVLALLLLLVGTVPAGAQQPPQIPLPTKELAQQNPQAPCLQPAPLLRWQDYKGPFNKVVATFARKIERTSVRVPRYKPGELLCSLTTKGKFMLFVEDSIEPATFADAAFSAGIDQAENTDPSFGQGAAGYGKRFGAELAGDASGEFFKEFVYPSVFSEDPRYYPLGHGTVKRRMAHAFEHIVVAHQENSKPMFNFSEWFGTASTVALADTYHPDNRPGIAPAARAVGYTFLQDAGFDVLREFWPEIARALKLPFRGQSEPPN